MAGLTSAWPAAPGWRRSASGSTTRWTTCATPRGAALAGEIADEVKVGGSANPAVVPVIRDRVAAGALAAGRSPAEIRVVLGAVTVVDRDGAAARRRARAEVARYLAAVLPRLR